jgi:hypothetical protein
MALVILIIGLSGSGKTHLAKELEASSIDPIMLIDDPTMLDLTKLDNTIDVIVTDPHLCNPRIRQNAINIFSKRGYIIDFIFFENDVEKCIKNVAYRADGRIISAEGMKSFFYEIPDGVKPLEIWQPNN